MEIFYDFYKNDFFQVKIFANKNGVFLISFKEKFEKPKPNLITRKALYEIDLYFNKKLKKFSFPVDLKLTTFQKLVLETVKNIPYGKVKTYKELAKKIGKERGYRAIGQVLKNNPLPLYYPCHRVIRSDGKIGGFSGGVEIKKKLLILEGLNLNESLLDSV